MRTRLFELQDRIRRVLGPWHMGSIQAARQAVQDQILCALLDVVRDVVQSQGMDPVAQFFGHARLLSRCFCRPMHTETLYNDVLGSDISA